MNSKISDEKMEFYKELINIYSGDMQQKLKERIASVDRSDERNDKFASILEDGKVEMKEVENFSYEEIKDYFKFQKENMIFEINGIDEEASKFLSSVNITPNEQFNRAFHNAVEDMSVMDYNHSLLELEQNLTDYYSGRKMYSVQTRDGGKYHESELLTMEQKAQINYVDFARTMLNMFDETYNDAKHKDVKEYAKTLRDMYSSITAELNKINSPYNI